MNQPQTNVPRSTSHSLLQANELTMKYATALLARFSLIWPKAWADSLHGSNLALVTSEWAKGLDGLTGDDIKVGIDYCRNHATWPPSIAEFRTACRGGANAEQRAYAARSSYDQEGVRAMRHGTWGDTAAVVADHVQSVRATLATRQATRSLRDIAEGLWTREMEANFCRHAAFLGRKVRPIEWPDEAIA